MRSRWIQLLLGLVCMVVISSPQYVWTLFTQPLMGSLHVSLAQIQITFSLLIVVQTFLSPCQGFLVDKFGPRALLSLGGALTGLSWVLAARASTLAGLYLTYGLLCGIGTGIVYVGVIGHMVQWFPDRRGFATGIVAAGYGMGAILTTFPISGTLKDAGYQPALARYGLIFMVVGVIAAQGLRAPIPNSTVPRPKVSARSSSQLSIPNAQGEREPFQRELHAARDAADADLLADVRHDDDDVDRGIDGDVADRHIHA